MLQQLLEKMVLARQRLQNVYTIFVVVLFL